MNILLKAAVVIGATSRLSSIISTEEITAPLRYKIEDWAHGHKLYSFPERLGYLVTCPRCSSVWAAAGVLALSTVPAAVPVLTVLAVSQAAIVVLNRLESAE